ncbi:hypothetical protein [Actinomadura sp. 9N407]|uniref:hypothetical protein n=1 Tax=Actinomadura sp. 9N407 TaxID=3375154 RepID=UPI0037A5480A
MELDEISAIADDYAARLGIRAPKVKQGRVLRYRTGGAWLRLRGRWPMLVVDSRFGALEPAEQEAWLAYVMSAAPRFRRWHWQQFLAWFPLVLIMVIVVIAVEELLPQLGEIPFLIVVLGGSLLIMRWYQEVCFKADRAVVDVFGWPVMDTILDLERRLSSRVGRALFSTPSPARRTARLEQFTRVPE